MSDRALTLIGPLIGALHCLIGLLHCLIGTLLSDRNLTSVRWGTYTDRALRLSDRALTLIGALHCLIGALH